MAYDYRAMFKGEMLMRASPYQAQTHGCCGCVLGADSSWQNLLQHM